MEPDVDPNEPVDPEEFHSNNIAYIKNINQNITKVSDIYDGFSLEISSLDTDHVKNLLDILKVLPADVEIALEMTLEHFNEVRVLIDDSQVNLDHIVLFLEDEDFDEKLLEVYNSCPKVPISVVVVNTMEETKDLTKKISKDCIQKKHFYSTYQVPEDLFSSFQTFEI
ncbi:hypothetical protein DSO57_1014511 [Entomophthora muscae]|uniref:Uncharacterized protein n=1 Tax=Entomophthora muscae TaxID=34485 RepID=A0ACC2T5E2_9FUNG|nr:hypothetical protein DSO57_1014511 [Entomophthora muscae]